MSATLVINVYSHKRGKNLMAPDWRLFIDRNKVRFKNILLQSSKRILPLLWVGCHSELDILVDGIDSEMR